MGLLLHESSGLAAVLVLVFVVFVALVVFVVVVVLILAILVLLLIAILVLVLILVTILVLIFVTILVLLVFLILSHDLFGLDVLCSYTQKGYARAYNTEVQPITPALLWKISRESSQRSPLRAKHSATLPQGR
jgi:energy-coupling factor transporter transmembrane protein EcfT